MTMNATRIAIGIDGGGTKTAAVIIDETGQVRGKASAGSSNVNSVGEDAARDALSQVVDAALIEAGRSLVHLDAICLCAAGVDRDDDRQRALAWLNEIAPQAKTLVFNDAVAALAAGTDGDLYGVVLISGTGMIVYGFDRHDGVARAGGWGPLLGDPGSGYDLGHRALKAIAEAVDGRGGETGLTERILDALELSHPTQLITWAYSDYAWERLAGLAPQVNASADDGDEVAAQILARCADGLVEAVGAVVDRLDFGDEAFPLVLSGGTLEEGTYAQEVRRRLGERFPRGDIRTPSLNPAHGAALLALASLESRDSQSEEDGS